MCNDKNCQTNQNNCESNELPRNSGNTTTLAEIMFVNHELMKQKDMLEEKMKAMKNELKQAKTSLNKNQCEKDAKKSKVPECNIAGLKSFVADQMWKHTKYVNEQVFDDVPHLVESCYVFLRMSDRENRSNFYLSITKIVKQKLVDMRKHYRSVLKTLVEGELPLCTFSYVSNVQLILSF